MRMAFVAQTGVAPMTGTSLCALCGLRSGTGLRELVKRRRATPPPSMWAAAAQEKIAQRSFVGAQTRPFLLYPSTLLLDDEPLIGAAAINVVLRRWRAELNGRTQGNGDIASTQDREEEPQPAAR
jgi:hypothetical protein